MRVDSVNNVSFRAVDPKIMKKAKEEFMYMETISGDLIEKLHLKISTKQLTKQDGLDTIKALRTYTKKGYQYLLDACEDFCKK